MRRVIFLLFAIITTSLSLAQTQQGIVKTRGRMVNGKVEPGKRLSDATITLNLGNPLVSNGQGTFSFNVPNGKSYSLVSAKKHGYTLADPEYTRRSFIYSAKNPFYVVLEDEAQRQADITEATRKVRKTMNAQLEKREDEIEELKRQNKLTEKEYQQKMQELLDAQEQSQQLVKEMAERYVSTDYDQLDEFNSQIQMYIEEGELQKADSMLRSKGNIEQRVTEYHNVVAANKKERENLEQIQRTLEQSESGAAKTYEDLLQDLLRQSEISLQTYQQDSALYYMKLRVDLDTTNVEAAMDYANLCYAQREFAECETYSLLCLTNYQKDGNLAGTANVQYLLGSLYWYFRNYEKSEQYYKSSLDNFEQLIQQESDDNIRFEYALSQSGLGILYEYLGNYKESEKYLTPAFSIIEQLFIQDPVLYYEYYAWIHLSMGILYSKMCDYSKSETYLTTALECYLELSENDIEHTRADLSKTYNALGNLYIQLENYEKSESNLKAAFEIIKNLSDSNPSAWTEDLSIVEKQLGYVYSILHEYPNSIEYYTSALTHIEQLCNKLPDVYQKDLAALQFHLGELHYNLCDFEAGAVYLYLAITNYEELYTQEPNTYSRELSTTYMWLTCLFASVKEYNDAMTMIDKAISLLPDNVNVYDTKGEILLMQGKNDEALEMWKKVIELNPNFLHDHPKGTELSNGLKKLGLIE